MIQNNKKLQQAIDKKTALFGTLDTWILYKLRRGQNLEKRVEHVSDVTSCSATGFYDPFTMQWAKWALHLFSIKVCAKLDFHINHLFTMSFFFVQAEMLPTVVDNSYDFGCIDKSLFGHEIPIGCSVKMTIID